MRAVFPTKALEMEDREIMRKILESDEDMTIDEGVQRFASEEYKKYFHAKEKERKRLWEEEGIRV